MTQGALASYLGVGQAYISNIENGRDKFPEKYIRKILDDPNVDSSMVQVLDSDNEIKIPREVFEKLSQLIDTVNSQQGTIAEQLRMNADQGKLIAEMYHKIELLTSSGSFDARQEDDAGSVAAK